MEWISEKHKKLKTNSYTSTTLIEFFEQSLREAYKKAINEAIEICDEQIKAYSFAISDGYPKHKGTERIEAFHAIRGELKQKLEIK